MIRDEILYAKLLYYYILFSTVLPLKALYLWVAQTHILTDIWMAVSATADDDEVLICDYNDKYYDCNDSDGDDGQLWWWWW